MDCIPQTIGQFGVAVLVDQTAPFLEHAPGARAGHSVRAVHQMRVATRRMRAALRLFGTELPRGSLEQLTTELKWTAAQLGNVRDLDVQLRRLAETAEGLVLADRVAPYQDWLRTRRQTAQENLTAALSGPRFRDLVDTLGGLTSWQPTGDEPTPMGAARRLAATFRSFNKRARQLTPKDETARFHKVRIRAKRVRYAVEFFEPLYGKAARTFIARLTDLQDSLGDLQDGVVSAQSIKTATDELGSGWPPPSLLALGQVLHHEAQHARRQKKRFATAYEAVAGKPWRRLESALDIS